MSAFYSVLDQWIHFEDSWNNINSWNNAPNLWKFNIPFYLIIVGGGFLIVLVNFDIKIISVKSLIFQGDGLHLKLHQWKYSSHKIVEFFCCGYGLMNGKLFR